MRAAAVCYSHRAEEGLQTVPAQDSHWLHQKRMLDMFAVRNQLLLLRTCWPAGTLALRTTGDRSRTLQAINGLSEPITIGVKCWIKASVAVLRFDTRSSAQSRAILLT